jgi:hypothetical protein
MMILGASSRTVRATVPEESLDVIIASASGQAKGQPDKCIRRRIPALVGVAEFRKNFHAFVQQNNMAGYLPTLSSSIQMPQGTVD